MYVNLLVIICFLFVGLSVRSELFLAAEPFSTFFTPLHFMYLCVPFHVLSGIEFLLTNNTDRFNVLLHVFLQEVLIWLSHKTFVANKTCWTVPHMLPLDVLLKIVFVHCCVFTRCARMHWNFRNATFAALQYLVWATCTCTWLPFWGKVGAVQTMWLNLWMPDQTAQPQDKKSIANLQKLYLCSDRDEIFVGLQYLVWPTCICTFWGKVGEVFTMWINLLMQNQVVQPHDKNQIRITPKILGLFWFDFLLCGSTTWFCINSWSHAVHTSPTFPQLHLCQIRRYAMYCSSNLYVHIVAIQVQEQGAEAKCQEPP